MDQRHSRELCYAGSSPNMLRNELHTTKTQLWDLCHDPASRKSSSQTRNFHFRLPNGTDLTTKSPKYTSSNFHCQILFIFLKWTSAIPENSVTLEVPQICPGISYTQQTHSCETYVTTRSLERAHYRAMMSLPEQWILTTERGCHYQIIKILHFASSNYHCQIYLPFYNRPAPFKRTLLRWKNPKYA